MNMPLKPSLVNAWYNACANDLFCTGTSGSYFDLPSSVCTPPATPGGETASCRKFKNIYANSSDMITRMWDGSFSVGTETAGFTFPAPGTPAYVTTPTSNAPNDAAAAASGRPLPPFCSFRPAGDGFLQALSDFDLYVRAAPARRGCAPG
jgi:hypothetical protein